MKSINTDELRMVARATSLQPGTCQLLEDAADLIDALRRNPVFVVMGNDFPAGVFSSETLADAYCERRKKELRPDGHPSRINWRVYEYTIDDGEKQ